MSTLSHLAQQKQESLVIKKRAMELLQWDDLTYGEFLFKCGTAYLQAYIPNDPTGIDGLVESKVFWNWWRIHWMRRDVAFVQSVETVSVVARRMIYEELHNPVVLAKEIYPNACVLSETYADMIGNYIKSIR